jgi:hypothetical protein
MQLLFNKMLRKNIFKLSNSRIDMNWSNICILTIIL